MGGEGGRYGGEGDRGGAAGGGGEHKLLEAERREDDAVAKLHQGSGASGATAPMRRADGG